MPPRVIPETPTSRFPGPDATVHTSQTGIHSPRNPLGTSSTINHAVGSDVSQAGFCTWISGKCAWIGTKISELWNAIKSLLCGEKKNEPTTASVEPIAAPVSSPVSSHDVENSTKKRSDSDDQSERPLGSTETPSEQRQLGSSEPGSSNSSTGQSNPSATQSNHSATMNEPEPRLGSTETHSEPVRPVSPDLGSSNSSTSQSNIPPIMFVSSEPIASSEEGLPLRERPLIGASDSDQPPEELHGGHPLEIEIFRGSESGYDLTQDSLARRVAFASWRIPHELVKCKIKFSFVGAYLYFSALSPCLTNNSQELPEAFHTPRQRLFLGRPLLKDEERRPIYLKYKFIKSISVICKSCAVVEEHAKKDLLERTPIPKDITDVVLSYLFTRSQSHPD